MNTERERRLKTALIESGSTIAFVYFFLEAPLLAVVLFVVSYQTNRR